MKNILCALIIACIYSSAHAQQTVGLFTQANGSEDGYVLFAPMMSTSTYLIDKCGKELHSWSSTHKPGQSVYLLEDGTLMRPGSTNNLVFTAGGSGGIIEQFDWNSNLLWSYTISDTLQCQHHDICPLPNGNILAIAWERKTITEAINAGRDPALTGTDFWSEQILELQPIGTNSANIVWEWHAWDHLVQDHDNSKNNYGTVSDHPELVNINHYSGQATNSDWLHMNAIAYNPALDQVMVSLHNFNEIWIIDHSTTTAEAASHTGGTHNKGGDLLYRWGNPAAYDRGTAADRKLFGQHNARWIEGGLPDPGKIMIFNNGNGRQPANYSSVDIIVPPVDNNGDYSITGSQPYEPANIYWSYADPTPTDFYAMNISGAQRLANGNTLICNGPAGTFFEVDSMGSTVWKYVNPINNTGAISQGSPATQNLVFRCSLYPVSYPGFANQTLTPGAPLEQNPLSYTCSTTGLAVATLPGQNIQAINPFDRDIVIQSESGIKDAHAVLLSISGVVCKVWNDIDIQPGRNVLATATDLPAGMYLLSIRNGSINVNLKLSKIY